MKPSLDSFYTSSNTSEYPLCGLISFFFFSFQSSEKVQVPSQSKTGVQLGARGSNDGVGRYAYVCCFLEEVTTILVQC